MHCQQCGMETEQHHKFCSRCGTALIPESSPPKPARDMETHFRVLSWLLIIGGILTAILGIVVIFAGSFLHHLPGTEDVPFGHLATTVAVFAGFSIVLLAGMVAAAGIGIRHYRTWGRVLATIVGVLLLFKFPFGTALSVYTFWVLFSEPGRSYFNQRTHATA